MNQSQRKLFIEVLSQLYPEPDTELHYDNEYQLLVAVILSAQATDISVNKALTPVFQSIKTPRDMLSMGHDAFAQAIRSIGLWRNKAKNVMLMSQDLLARFDGEVPNTRDDLMSLAGVGRKTANVVLNVAFDQPTIAVDTHIFRVCNRTRFAIGKTPDHVELKLEKVVPNKDKKEIHIRLILFGRYICRAQKPLCSECQILPYCKYGQKQVIA